MKIERADEEDTVVSLDLYNSDLNLVIDASRYSAHPLTSEGFAFMWAGARASYGFNKGKICYEVKVVKYLDVSHLPADEPNPHVVRVGFSVEDSTLQLGEDPLSYGYGGTGKMSTNCQFKDYGTTFAEGDTIMGILNMDMDPIQMGFAKNGKFLGWAYKVMKPQLKGKALFPHILTKNCSFEVNFGQKERPFFPLPDGFKDFTFVSCVPLDLRVRGTVSPAKREDCEMVMMCGLPGAGKSVWAADYASKFPEKKYNLLGTNNIIDKMKVMGLPRKRNYHGRWDVLIQMATKCLNKMFEIGSKLRRNYILDQTNVYPTAQRRKMRNFEGFKRRAVVVVPTEEEYKRRCDKRDREEGKEIPEHAILEMKANFKLPEVCDIFDEVLYTELKRDESEKLVQKYNEEGKSSIGPNKKNFRGNQPSGFGGARGGSQNRSASPSRGGFNNRGSFDNRRGSFEGGRGAFGRGGRGGFDRGGSNGGRGGFDSGRGGYDGGRGNFDSGRGGYDSGRGNFDSGRGGYDSGRFDSGGFDSGFESGRGGFGGSNGGRGGYDSARGGSNGGRGGFDRGRGNRGSFDKGRGGFRGSRGMDGGRGGYRGSYGDEAKGGFGSYGQSGYMDDSDTGRGFDGDSGGRGYGRSGGYGEKAMGSRGDSYGSTGYQGGHYGNNSPSSFNSRGNTRGNYSSRGDFGGGRGGGYGGDSSGPFDSFSKEPAYDKSGYSSNSRGFRGSRGRGARNSGGNFRGGYSSGTDYSSSSDYDRNYQRAGSSDTDYSRPSSTSYGYSSGGQTSGYRSDSYDRGASGYVKKEPFSGSQDSRGGRSNRGRQGPSRWSSDAASSYSQSGTTAPETNTYSGYSAPVKTEPVDTSRYDSYSSQTTTYASYGQSAATNTGYQTTASYQYPQGQAFASYTASTPAAPATTTDAQWSQYYPTQYYDPYQQQGAAATAAPSYVSSYSAK